jgi:hypothetical protein|tara:strand:- start:1598 stop:1897 length:300 start_codon:yes stop_codon:yes gene_type:complete
MTNNKKTRVTTNMKNTIVNEINKMNSEEINELIGVIKRRRQVLGSMAASLFAKGDKVTFENNGQTEPGVVFKVKRKYIEVDILDGAMRYNVPATMLTRG